jgi:hypothetical protein
VIKTPHDLKPAKFGSPNDTAQKPKSKKLRDAGRKDDTPRAFARLMQLRDTGKGIKGLDDGSSDPKSKKRKRGAQLVVPTQAEKQPLPAPKIQPGERLADFAARVNAALPVAGLARKGKAVDGEFKERQTKHEKRLQKMVNTWKEEEVKRADKRAEARELAADDEEEEDALWESRRLELTKSKKGKSRKELDVDDDWAALRAKREEPKGLHDVAQAPPELKKPREVFKEVGRASSKTKAEKVVVANVPMAAGSLRRREELGETRLSIIESYRTIMRAQRAEERAG